MTDRITRPGDSNADWLRAVIDTAVDGVILIDSGGRILMFNPACEKLFGYPTSEVIGQNVKLLMPAAYRGAHDGYLQNYHRTGDRKIIGIGREVTGQRKDGSTFLMHLSVGETKQASGQATRRGLPELAVQFNDGVRACAETTAPAGDRQAAHS